MAKRPKAPSMVTIPIYLEAVASLHGISGADVARALGVSPSLVRRWRRGQLVPGWHRVRQMVSLYGGDAELLNLGASLQRFGRETGLSVEDAIKLVKSGRRTAPQRRKPRPAVDRNQLSLPMGGLASLARSDARI